MTRSSSAAVTLEVLAMCMTTMFSQPFISCFSRRSDNAPVIPTYHSMLSAIVRSTTFWQCFQMSMLGARVQPTPHCLNVAAPPNHSKSILGSPSKYRPLVSPADGRSSAEGLGPDEPERSSRWKIGERDLLLVLRLQDPFTNPGASSKSPDSRFSTSAKASAQSLSSTSGPGDASLLPEDMAFARGYGNWHMI